MGKELQNKTKNLQKLKYFVRYGKIKLLLEVDRAYLS